MARTLRLIILSCSLLVAATLTPSSAAAEPLDSLLGTLNWGDSAETVLETLRERVLAGYRVEVAGIVDPLQVDRIRRRADDRIEAIESTFRQLDGARTGFEVSAISGEIAAGAGIGLINARWPEGHIYYVLQDNALRRLMVVLEPTQFGGLDFEELAEALDARHEVPGERGDALDDIGRRNLMRMTWTDDSTTLRLENRQDMFHSWLLVVSDVTWDGPVPELADPTPPAERLRGSRRSVSDLIQGLESSEAANQDTLIDNLFGTDIEVRTMLRSDEERAEEEAEEERRREEEAAAERELEEERARQRRARERARQPQQRQQEPEEGVTFY